MVIAVAVRVVARRMHRSDNGQNVGAQCIVIINSEGVIGVAQESIGWSGAEAGFDQQTISRELHHV